MMHFDFETQYTLKIPKPQDLVKFNSPAKIHVASSKLLGVSENATKTADMVIQKWRNG
jgi:hypothetical protein